MCLSPMLSRRNQFGKIVFESRFKADSYFLKKDYFLLPCSQCIQCRLSQARDWAIRSTHEAMLFEESCFLTLTYDEDHLPKDASLCHEHFQLFMKLLRYHAKGSMAVSHKGKVTFPIRVMMCGEYGDENCRPHYHACIYNFDFPDKYAFKKSNGFVIYRSDFLESLWPHGIVSIGSLTFESASYVARYCLKKRKGDSDDFYGSRAPDYGQFPRGYGLGLKWLERFYSDVYPHGYVVLRRGEDSFKVKPPAYYDSWYEARFPDSFQELKLKRQECILEHAENFSFEKLAIKQKIFDKRLKELVRVLEQ